MKFLVLFLVGCSVPSIPRAEDDETICAKACQLAGGHMTQFSYGDNGGNRNCSCEYPK